jgi:flagellar biosynthesis protein FlhB
MAEQDSDRSEAATQFKLEQERKRGSVARSVEVSAVAVLGALAVSMHVNAWDGFVQALNLQVATLARARQLDWSPDGVAAWIGDIAQAMLGILAPLLVAVALCAILATLLQTGPVLSTTPLGPDFTRLNPATGLKRFFSLRILYEAFKSTVKLVVLSAVAYFAIADALPGLMALPAMGAKTYARTLLALSASVLTRLVFALFILAVLDFAYTRWEFAKRMRMSKRDIKDEHKNREGDPRIRSRQRELRQEVLKRAKAMHNLPSADVLITNPTHLAVALSYDHGSGRAPTLVAKGAGELAAHMREVARRHHIPIVQNRKLARALYKEVDPEGYVPERLYGEIARLMVWVYALRNGRRQGGAASVSDQ